VDHRTPLRELVEDKLGYKGGVCAWAAKRREESGASWETLVSELHEITGRKISWDTLRRWCEGVSD
jgi:hypothetical protein